MNATHFHLMLNHIPVLGGIATTVLLALAVLRRNDAINKLTLQFMVFVGVMCFPVYFTGEPAEDAVEHLPGVMESYISQHETLGLYSLITTEILAVIGVLGLLSLRKNPNKFLHYWKAVLAVAIINAGLMLATANRGGEIRHTEIRNGAAPELEDDD